MDKWYLKSGQDSDIVFSVRVRLARNLSGFPFPNKMTEEQKYDVIQRVADSIFNSEYANEYRFVDMDKISEVEAYSLVERHLISPEFAANRKGRALILKNDESVSIMINEEDHIRIQCISCGLEFENTIQKALSVEKIIEKNVEFAFDKKFGYLTECPTNLGTGMRASAMIHLPALQAVGALDGLFSSIAKFGLTVRGTFGEGTKAKSSMYQISNQITLGVSENESIDKIKNIVSQFVKKEKQARVAFNNVDFEDASNRALGILKYARKVTSNELFKLISDVRFGVSLGVLNVPMSIINQLSLICGSYGVSLKNGEVIEAEERDVLRAKFIRESLKDYN